MASRARRPGRFRRILRKTLRWGLRVVLALVCLVLVVLVLVLYSPGFLHVVINVGLGFYNDRIPGEIRIGRVEGRLADHLVLGDIYLEDRNGRVLVSGRELTLDWRPWDLLSGGITVDRIALDGAQVHLVAGGGFGDLAMPGPEEPPRETIAPAMPLHLWVGDVQVSDVDLYQDSGETIAGGVRLAARDLDWSGLVAHLKIDDAAAKLPGVQLEALALTADYAEPHLQLTGLVTSDLAIAELVRVDFDAASLTGEVLVAVDGRRGALAEKFTGPLADKLRDAPGDPSIRISAQGQAGDLELGLHALVPGIGGLELAASGRPVGAPRLELRGRADVDLAGLLPPPHGAKFGLVRPTFEADVSGPDWTRLTAELRLGCRDCGVASGLNLHALARNDSVLSDASAFVELVGAGVAVKAEVLAGPRGVEAGRWDVRIPVVEEPLGIARLFVNELPPISGALATRGSCTGAPLRCEGNVEVGKFIGYGARVGSVQVHAHGEPLAPVPVAHAEVSVRDLAVPGYRFAGAEISAAVGPSESSPPDTEHPQGVLEAAVAAEVWVRERDRGDRGKIAARVLPGPPLVILLDALDVRLRGLQALLPRPARVEIVGRRFDVENLALLASGGQIAVDGRVDLDGRSDIKATIDDVRLAPLAALVPKLRGKLVGTVSARASLQGPAQTPEVSLELGVRKLGFGEGTLGDLDVSVGVGKGRARAAVGMTGTMAERIAAAAEVPLDLDLSRGKVGVHRGGMHLALDIKNFRLAALRPWVEGMPPRGLITVQATVDGSAANPAIKVMARGRGIVLSDKEPPASFDLDVEQKAGEDATVRLDAERLGGRVRINVTKLPARINLVDGGYEWRPEEEHAATIVVRDVDLWRQLNPLLPGNDFAGRIEAEGSITGPMTAPVLELAVKGDGLRMRDAQIGRLRLGVGFADQKATVDVAVRGQVARELTLHAEAPLAVALARGKVAWLKDDPHVLTAKIRGFDLAGLKQLGVTAAWAGVVDVDAQLRGSASVPELKVHTDLKEIVWKRRRIGTVHGDVDYHGKRVKAGVHGQIGNGTIDLKANAPLVVDLGRGSFQWDENGQHDVELRVDGLDRTMLAPLGRVPEEALIELSLVAQARGNLASFHAGLEAHGQMGHKLIGGAPLHISAVVDPKSQSLRYSLGPHQWAGHIAVKVDSKADILGLVRGAVKAADIPFTASLRAPKFDSRFAQAFVPRNLYDLNGTLSASVDAKGTVGAPDVRGELHLRRGSITVLELQQRIREIELDVTASGRTIVLEKLTASSGKGRLRGTARVELPRGGGMKLTSEVKLARFPLVRPGLPQMQIDTQVNADMVSTAEETDVDLKIAKTRVYVTGYTVDPPKQIPVSENVRIKDDTQIVAVATAEGADGEVTAENEEREPEEEEPAPSKRFAVHIRLVDPVDIRGPSIEMLWQGKVAAIREGEQREVKGKLNAKEGRLDLLGNRFKIQSGSVTLPEDEDTVDPFINVVATTSTTVAEVKATFRGRLTRPELIFSSEPAMSQSQILTLLLTGSPDANEADEERVLAQAAALLATFQNPQLSAFLSSRLGIDHVGLSFGDDVNQPILSVGKRVTRKIYVETAYKHNAPRQKNRVEARVEYQFAPQWTVETFFGDAAVGGVDVFWRKVFGQPKPLDRSKPAPKRTGKGDGRRGGETTEAPGGGGTGAGSGGSSR